MLDAKIRPLIDPPLNAMGLWLARLGISANVVTMLGMALGLAAAMAIAQGRFQLAIALILASRLADGLDGAVARATAKTPFGGYLDIVGDFIFYVSVPVAFGLFAPANLLPAMLLLAAFALTGVSFLAFASIAAEQGLESRAHGEKSFFYSTGLAEGFETIAMFVAMCLFPGWFPALALGFAALCALTVIQRSWLAWRLFRPR